MKKIIMTAALVACAAVVTAQTVTSVNIVGYNKDVSAVGLHISAVQFNNATNTPSTVYGDSLSLGSKVYLFNGVNYDTSTYASIFVPGQGLATQWSADLDLGDGQGHWVEVSTEAETIISGEVPLDAAITNQIDAGLSLVAYPYPVERVITGLGFVPASGDKIYVFNGVNYDTSTYASIFVPIMGMVMKWSDETLSVAVGEGFWYETEVAQSWVVNKPF